MSLTGLPLRSIADPSASKTRLSRATLGFKVGLGLVATLATTTLPNISALGQAVPSMRVQQGITRALSPHVYVIPANGRSAVPNVGIVVGSRAVLIIETGLGKASGQVVYDESRRLAAGRSIYVIATHSHLEHLGGEQAFPASATILRPRLQQQEVDASGSQSVSAFRRLSTDNATLLKEFAFRPADILFDGPLTLDLGGVTVDIMNAGPAHSNGDIALLVREDGVLFTGDVVQQNYAPVLSGSKSNLQSWLAQIDTLERLSARIIVPSHSAITDRQAFANARGMIVFIQQRWASLKASGLTPADARNQLVADFKQRYPACTNADLLKITAARL